VSSAKKIIMPCSIVFVVLVAGLLVLYTIRGEVLKGEPKYAAQVISSEEDKIITNIFVPDRRIGERELLEIAESAVSAPREDAWYILRFYGEGDYADAGYTVGMVEKKAGEEFRVAASVADWSKAPGEEQFAAYWEIMNRLYANPDIGEDTILAGLEPELEMSVDEMKDLLKIVLPYTQPTAVG